ncbi:50S ribosomal protein L3 [Candidatus Microgenomates bacterium]|nr:50S ribosomal protein L3 [Candidatus Microgenomates bacterium]
MSTFYGFKMGSTQDYDQAGKRWPITMVKVEPMTVAKNSQIAFGHKNKKTPNFLKSYQTDKTVGEKIIISDVFNSGDKIKVTGISKGKGFQGVVRRHGFHGGPKTHGQSDRQRHPGSIGQTTTPGRVYKGKRMAGHMGAGTVTVKNLEVFAIKPEENLLYIRGLVPGGKNGLLKLVK